MYRDNFIKIFNTTQLYLTGAALYVNFIESIILREKIARNKSLAIHQIHKYFTFKLLHYLVYVYTYIHM